MKQGKLFLIAAVLFSMACRNTKKGEPDSGYLETTTLASNQGQATALNAPANNSGSGVIIFMEGKGIALGGSLLVQIDKDKLQPGNDYLVTLTATGAANDETLQLNFLLALKTGRYPVVGMSYQRGQQPNSQLFGNILGGKPHLTKHTINITECRDLGSNNMGGHRWSISGEFSELTIAAMGIMLMDKTKNHPKEIKIEKGSFSNLTFDDNWEEMMNKATESIKKN